MTTMFGDRLSSQAGPSRASMVAPPPLHRVRAERAVRDEGDALRRGVVDEVLLVAILTVEAVLDARDLGDRERPVELLALRR